MASIEFPLSFTRQYSGPLDPSLVFPNLTQLMMYTAEPEAYAGQIVAVNNDSIDSRNTIYVLQEDETGFLEPIAIPKNSVTSDSVSNIVKLTQTEYDAITTPDPLTLYVIIE